MSISTDPHHPASLALKFTSDPNNLAPVRHEVEQLVAAAGFDETARNEIGLVVNEALANVIRHAYHNETSKPIELIARANANGIEVVIRDWGSGQNPAGVPSKLPGTATPGGLGLVCMRKLMDVVDYQPQPDGMRLVLIRRKRGPST